MRSVKLNICFGKVAPMIIFSMLALSVHEDASALEWQNGKWQVHGFVSQALTYTDNNEVFGSSSDVSLDFREMGINTSVKVLPNLLVSAQGLYRDAGASDTQGVRLDFAQADYSIQLLDSALVLGGRGGRVKIPFGFYNDTRDVLWTRPTVLLPQSIYLDTLALRQSQIAADGGILYSRYTMGNHRLGAEFMAADLQDNTGGTAAFITGMPDAKNTGGNPLILGRAVYEWMGGRVRFMATIADVNRDYSSSLAMNSPGNVKLLMPLFSAQYNAERWSLTSEYLWIDSQRSGFYPSTQKNTSESVYLQGEYRFTSDLSGILRYDVFHVSRNDRDGSQLSEQTGLPRHRFYARDLTVGVRWEFARNFLLAADYHHVDGTAWLNTTDNPDLNSGGGASDWNLFMTMLSFRF